MIPAALLWWMLHEVSLFEESDGGFSLVTNPEQPERWLGVLGVDERCAAAVAGPESWCQVWLVSDPALPVAVQLRGGRGKAWGGSSFLEFGYVSLGFTPFDQVDEAAEVGMAGKWGYTGWDSATSAGELVGSSPAFRKACAEGRVVGDQQALCGQPRWVLWAASEAP